MKDHRPVVYWQQGHHRAQCWCGWHTGPQNKRPTAEALAAAHQADPGPLCEDTQRVGPTVMVCVRAVHHGTSYSAPGVEASRRRKGMIVNADRHVYVAREA